MSKFEVVFSTDNAAFVAFPDEEISRILREIADRIEVQGMGANEPVRVRDINGNRVGFWNYSYKEEKNK